MNENTGEKNLANLIKSMAPVLQPQEYVFLTFAGAQYGDRLELNPVAAFAETEGLTLVVPKRSAVKHDLEYNGVFRCITLQVHSSLEAVGLTAAFATQLGSHNISANVIAGFYHDHIFVSVADANRAMTALNELAGES